MSRRANIVRAAAGVFLLPGCGRAAEPVNRDAGETPMSLARPLWLQQDPYESIYLPPGPPREEEGVNAGGANFNLRISYVTDYVYRGVDQSEQLSSINGAGQLDP